MYADVAPNYLELAPGATGSVLVRISNSSTLIDAYGVSLFGLDPEWVTVKRPRLSLFPSESDVIEVEISLPENFPAGHRQLSINVRSENDPSEFTLVQFALVAVERPRLTLRLDPVLVTAGKQGNFGMIVTNEGNTTVTATPEGIDPEEKAQITFQPTVIELAPGRQEVIRAEVVAKRPWLGAPKIRVLTFAVNSHQRTQTMGTFMQKPRINRGLLSIMGLLAAAAVFAAVLSRTFDNVINQASVDSGLLASALDKDAGSGNLVPVDPGTITGKVILFSTGDGVAGVQADLFRASDDKVPIASAATAEDGAYAFGRLRAGDYKLRFSGAGFTETWFESGPTAADATEVKVELGKATALADVQLGGRPGTIKGLVTADDPTGAKATLFVKGAITEDTAAQVQSTDVSADGTFTFENVPSPANYQLVVEKPGYAPSIRDVVVGPAQTIDGVEIALRKGDGEIKGAVQGVEGALGGVAISATDGSVVISTVTLTEGEIGAYALRGLPTPASYTLTITRDGYATETRTVTLGSAQVSTDNNVQLQPSLGSITGRTTVADLGPIGGVTVTISGGDTVVTTTTVSNGTPEEIGSFYVDDLPLPNTYTVTFSKTGLVSQVRPVDLDPLQGTSNVTAVDVQMATAAATVQGTVRGVDGQPVAQATVVLTDGNNIRTLLSANDPIGRFEFTGVAAGAYTLEVDLTGTTKDVSLVNVTSSEVAELDIRLDAQASLTGQVLLLNPATAQYEPAVGLTVRLFLVENFPGPASNAAGTVVTDANGNYTFSSLAAPDDFTIAVYSTGTSPDSLDSTLVATQPSTQLTVPTFRLLALF